MRINSSKILVFIGIIISGVGLGGYFIISSFKTFIQLPEFLIGAFLLTCCYYLISKLFLIHKVQINEIGIEILHLFPKFDRTIPFSSIISYNEKTEKDGKGNTNQIIILLLKENTKFSISRNADNFDALKNWLLNNNIKQDTTIKEKFDLLGTAMILFIVVFLTTIIIFSYTKPSDIDFSNMEAIISEKPEKNYVKGVYQGVHIHLSEYSDFRFFMPSEIIDDSDADNFTTSVNVGDTVYVQINTVDYKTKITKSEEPDFFTRYVGWSIIHVYELKYKNTTYRAK